MKSNNRFLDQLKKGPILFDGGIGTEIYNRGIFLNKCFEELNLTNKQLITQLHEDYKKAGADVIKTNTFGANYLKLKKYNLEDKLDEINSSGVKLAKDVAGEDVFVAGAMGPLGIQIEPLGKLSSEEAKVFFIQQAKSLIDSGVDLILLETFINHEELEIAVKSIKSEFDIPVIAQIAPGPARCGSETARRRRYS